MSTSHSAEFIAEMRQKLEAEQRDLQKRLGIIAHKGEESGFEADFVEYGRNDEENANEIADTVALSATTEAMEARLKEIEEALERVEKGAYGVSDSGELIPEGRLRANPAATTTIGSK